MKAVEIYEAFDGKTFRGSNECSFYEEQKALNDFEKISKILTVPLLWYFDCIGYNGQDETSVFAVHVESDNDIEIVKRWHEYYASPRGAGKFEFEFDKLHDTFGSFPMNLLLSANEYMTTFLHADKVEDYRRSLIDAVRLVNDFVKSHKD